MATIKNVRWSYNGTFGTGAWHAFHGGRMGAVAVVLLRHNEDGHYYLVSTWGRDAGPASTLEDAKALALATLRGEGGPC